MIILLGFLFGPCLFHLQQSPSVFRLNCCYYEGKCCFSHRIKLSLDQVQRDFYSTRQPMPSQQGSDRRKRPPPQFPKYLEYEVSQGDVVRETIDQNCPPWPGLIVTTYLSCLTTGGPGKECEATGYHQPEFRKGQGERRCQYICPTNLPESSSLECILAE